MQEAIASGSTAAPTQAAAAPVNQARAVGTTAAPTQAAAVMNSVFEVRVRIDADFATVSSDVEAFKKTFQEGVAAAAGVTTDRIVISNVRPGSVVVDFYVVEGTQGSTPMSVAVSSLEAKMKQTSTEWTPGIAAFMKKATFQGKALRSVPSEQVSSSGRTVVLTPLADYGPASGCSCVAGSGISKGCAEHSGVGPAWCLVASGCPSAMAGSFGSWAWCQKLQDSGATNSSSADRQRVGSPSASQRTSGNPFSLLKEAVLLIAVLVLASQ
eukprot:CAMPEP_0115086606 /NCGR_PEP_ID=MMETSP0227-20121206/22696_1 /TAXON_ID=89957 /ORGANISM="Polarella glacialis, Strain CCMP 1383" /LENGTH=268 /DNA_ID=CAMNT_0002476117 /DNA_START=68 /DNA_END=874 /DNA_ORIENTATION=-